MTVLLRIIALLSALLLSGCITLNPDPYQEESSSLPPVESGILVGTATKLNIAAGQTAAMPLSGAKEAMDWRLALIDNATRSIDIQYFIWSSDAAGRLVFDRLLRAADRGVRVRLLVDDLALEGKDVNIATLSKHANFEIRIYNPGSVRKSALGAIGEFMLYFRELNRRMHNKLFVVDNRFAILGGRNIGNPYFGLSDKYNNRDLDILLAGAVVTNISNAFDDYWNADLAYPGEEMSDRANISRIPALRRELDKQLDADTERLQSYPLDRQDWHALLATFPARADYGEAFFLQDIPISEDGRELKLVDMIDQVAGESDEEIIIVSPYFIPTNNLLEDIAAATLRGVKVKIITGSLGSNNHTAVHSHYRKYRRRIHAAGAELYEFRHDPAPDIRAISDVPPVTAKFISLHAKALVGDRNKVFIGSLNLDPRAVIINTENGVYFESAALGEDLGRLFDEMMSPENAWQVRLDDNDNLTWTAKEGVKQQQPARHFGQRIADFLYRLLPIESQL